MAKEAAGASRDASAASGAIPDVSAEAAATALACRRRAKVDIRPLETLDQMAQACQLFDAVWGIAPGEMSEVQPSLLRALGHGGNYLAGAYRAGTSSIVGASVAFFTEPLGRSMHSHITGVAADEAARGVGAALKWHQREWALHRGLGRITWTYDPLIARNAFFNLTRLGARPGQYFADFYGPMQDQTNRGQPTDRVEVVWELTAGRTIDAASQARGELGSRLRKDDAARDPSPHALLAVGTDGGPVGGPALPAGATDIGARVTIGIPPDIESMRHANPALALSWRYRLRAVLAPLLDDTRWRFVGFARPGWYELERTDADDPTGADPSPAAAR